MTCFARIRRLLFRRFPWEHGAKSFRLHRLQPWDGLHHDVLWEVWKHLAKLQRHRQLQIQPRIVHILRVGQHYLHHRHLALLVDLEKLQPLQNTSTFILCHHRAPIDHCDIDLSALTIFETALLVRPNQCEVKVSHGTIHDVDVGCNKIFVLCFRRKVSVVPSANCTVTRCPFSHSSKSAARRRACVAPESLSTMSFSVRLRSPICTTFNLGFPSAASSRRVFRSCVASCRSSLVRSLFPASLPPSPKSFTDSAASLPGFQKISTPQVWWQ